MAGQALEYPPQRAAAHPELKPPMTGLIGRVARRQVVPRGPGPHDPQDAIQHIARIAPRTSAAVTPDPRRGEQRCDQSPLPFGEIHRHPPGRSGPPLSPKDDALTPRVFYLRDGF